LVIEFALLTSRKKHFFTEEKYWNSLFHPVVQRIKNNDTGFIYFHFYPPPELNVHNLLFILF
jgi:hypothetical protein